ncbi:MULTISPECIES: rhomboid family intramembrane serine protease GlpG [Pseudoalteromonas]|jgi:GlpG protein|uniref:rhomboid family intramembrane serine protease GlpG n=1 Tax=Pseudoalteromonas TaxID=53246 RepID=UPI0002CC1991|nr:MULTISPECIES: rhomboid family intramembrane serine protease GlpG [Pseudoalteromonas]MAJ41236.1 rhomboid family intramembrane serine protease GlpG [Pseudoalteromonadaceae bacterium]OUX83526.1 MAG: rhomboid family intramembrane serine protease GlpG [Pseudoalteromonas sp. TMED43]ENN98014.1 GlpG protein [Pseudoalteromonas agarivorans S816]KPW03939.1 Rhomboid protease GlpG [Pseudoalteromonas sp. P1-11]MCK8095156.1 rhomboid family intramembrane serine protease GlpG [Pseudoalteromonas sp. 1CM17D]|tara:strand:+ start:138 stop:959 length:822 start_codon:yes stop_codon:yes gene_type:complete
MIELGSLNNPRAAQGFIDYLKSQGLEGQLRSADGSNVIICVAGEHFHQVQPLWAEFVQNPNHERYQQASWDVGSTQSGLTYQGQSLNLVARFKALSWLNKTVSIVSVAIYFAFLLGGFEQIYTALQFNPSQPLNWLTPALVHFSAMHIVFNLIWWMSLGDNIEKQCGKLSLVGLFVVTALISNWAQFLIVGPNFGGLSGVVYGLLGFCWIHSYLNPKQPALVSTAIIGFMLIWLVLGFADVLFVGMANWAHLGGLLSGMAYAVTANLFNAKKA